MAIRPFLLSSRAVLGMALFCSLATGWADAAAAAQAYEDHQFRRDRSARRPPPPMSPEQRLALLQRGGHALRRLNRFEPSCPPRGPQAGYACQQFHAALYELAQLCPRVPMYCQIVASVKNRRGWEAMNPRGSGWDTEGGGWGSGWD